MRTPLPLAPGAVVGVLGGGQLGRMLTIAAARLGLKTHIFSPEEPCPAGDVCAARTCADYGDREALAAFAGAVDVVTYEFENVPAETISTLEAFGAAVAPNAHALATAQDRLYEKDFVRSLGALTADYAAVDDLAGLSAALAAIGRPAILKTRRFGYDGKGQTRLTDAISDLSAAWEDAKRRAWDELGAQPSILERAVDFIAEISVIGARGRAGDIALYDCPENFHENGVLRRSVVPARVSAEAQTTARRITGEMLQALDYVGVIGVEFFVTRDGTVLVNEFAPRVHNSGHWTLDGCAISQFEQHIRAVAGWPLGAPDRHSDVEMINLLGDDVADWRCYASEPGACLHLYGKGAPRPGRKMGHVTRLRPFPDI